MITNGEYKNRVEQELRGLVEQAGEKHLELALEVSEFLNRIRCLMSEKHQSLPKRAYRLFVGEGAEFSTPRKGKLMDIIVFFPSCSLYFVKRNQCTNGVVYKEIKYFTTLAPESIAAIARNLPRALENYMQVVRGFPQSYERHLEELKQQHSLLL